VNFEIRDATANDATVVADLFHNTILNVNVGDYSVAQVEAWAGPAPEPEMWSRRIAEDSRTRKMFVATTEEEVVGFAELEVDGHVDTLYVHHEYQGCGIASALLDSIEAEARRLGLGRLYTEASITAEPFFRGKGFSMVRPQLVELRGQTFRNFVMEKVGFA
jgi:N-acetylglutamate synthase-like GNAT family acetyltransferase